MSDSKTFYILRHGETYATKNNTNYSPNDPNPPILEEGMGVLQKIGEYFKNIESEVNLVSEYLRCQMTADIVSKIADMQFISEPLLNEAQTMGVEKKSETISEFLDRTKRLYEKIISSENKSLFLITHGANIGTLKSLLVKGVATEESIYDFPKPGVLTVIKNNQISELDFN